MKFKVPSLTSEYLHKPISTNCRTDTSNSFNSAHSLTSSRRAEDSGEVFKLPLSPFAPAFAGT